MLGPYYRIVEKIVPVSFIIWDKILGQTKRAHANDLLLAEIADWAVSQKGSRQGKQALGSQKK